MPDTDNLFTEPMASRFTRLRKCERSNHKLTYDCMNAILNPEDTDSVICRNGRELKGPGRRTKAGLPLRSVLTGATCKACQICPDRNEEIDE